MTGFSCPDASPLVMNAFRSIVVRDLSVQIALQGQALAQYCEQRERRRLRAERAIFEQDAASRHAVGEGDEGRTTDWIEHNPRSATASDLHDSCDEILLIRHDNMICSVVNERLPLGPGPSGCDDCRAHSFCNLERSNTDTA